MMAFIGSTIGVVNKCLSTITSKVLLMRPHHKLGQHCAVKCSFLMQGCLLFIIVKICEHIIEDNIKYKQLIPKAHLLYIAIRLSSNH